MQNATLLFEVAQGQIPLEFSYRRLIEMFPKKRLTPLKTMHGRDFMNVVGSIIFEGSWESSDIEAVVSLQYPYWLGDIDTPENRKTFVQHQILEALASEFIEAEVRISDVPLRTLHYQLWVRQLENKDFAAEHPQEPVQDTTSKDGGGEIEDAIELEADEEDDDVNDEETELPKENEEKARRLRAFENTLPKFFHPRIFAGFWRNQLERPNIDWSRSVVVVPAHQLTFDSAGGNRSNSERWLNSTILGSHHKDRSFDIRNAELALAKIGIPYPDGVKGFVRRQFPQQDEYFWPEIIAAIWRIVAVKGLGTKHGDNALIRDELDKYFVEAGFTDTAGNKQPGISTLNKVIGEVVDQFKRKELHTPVLVNTNTYSPKLLSKKPHKHGGHKNINT